MVIIRSQSNRNNLPETEITRNKESDHSIPGELLRKQGIQFEHCDLLNQDRNYARNKIEQRFSDMDRRIGELTNIVLTLTRKISSNISDGNGKNFFSNESNSRSVK